MHQRRNKHLASSKQTLSDLIFGKQVLIKIQNKDRWQRAIVWVYTSDKKDISAEMIKAGWHGIIKIR